MATETEMVVLDGVRYRRSDVVRLFPDRVKDATPVNQVAEYGHGKRVAVAPGAAVTGENEDGSPIVDTTESAAANTGVLDVPGESVGSGDEDTETSKRPQRRAGTKKQQ